MSESFLKSIQDLKFSTAPNDTVIATFLHKKREHRSRAMRSQKAVTLVWWSTVTTMIAGMSGQSSLSCQSTDPTTGATTFTACPGQPVYLLRSGNSAFSLSLQPDGSTCGQTPSQYCSMVSILQKLNIELSLVPRLTSFSKSHT